MPTSAFNQSAKHTGRAWRYVINIQEQSLLRRVRWAGLRVTGVLAAGGSFRSERRRKRCRKHRMERGWTNSLSHKTKLREKHQRNTVSIWCNLKVNIQEIQSVFSSVSQRVKFGYSAKNCREFLQSNVLVVKMTFSKKSHYIIARVTEEKRNHLNAPNTLSFVYNSVKVSWWGLCWEKKTPF